MIKKWQLIIGAFLVALLMGACADQTEPTLVKISRCEIEPQSSEQMDLKAIAAKQDILFTLRWSKAQFIMSNQESVPVAPIKYAVEIDFFGHAFDGAQTYAIVTGTDSLEIPVQDFSNFLISTMGAKPNENNRFELRIAAQYGEGSNYTYSKNVLELNLIPFASYGPLQAVYIIGDMNNNDFENRDFRIFRADNQDVRNYTYTGKLSGSFALYPQDAFGSTDVYYPAADGKLAYGQMVTPFTVDEEGYYTLNVNFDAMTYSIEPYDVTGKKEFTSVSFMGQWCNWETTDPQAELTPNAYDPHIWSATFTLSTVQYGVKFCANGGWSDKWQPDADATAEIPYGVALYNETITGDPNFALGEEIGTYFVMLNDLTGHYIIEKQ